MSDEPEKEDGRHSSGDEEIGEESAQKSGINTSSGHESTGEPSAVAPFPDISPGTWKFGIFKTTTSADRENQEVVDEIADDLLELIKRTAAVEGQLRSMASVLEQLQITTASAVRIQAIEIEKLKETLIEDRKEYIGRATFNAIRPAIESLSFMMDALRNRPEDEALLRQTGAVLDLLNGITHLLGYHPFEVAPGDDFNPQTMECAGYEPGRDGKVVRVEQPGYAAGSLLVRPCKVILGRKTTACDH